MRDWQVAQAFTPRRMRTIEGWIERSIRALPGITYVKGDGLDLASAWDAARKAVAIDPEFAAGWGVLAWLIMENERFYGEKQGDWLAASAPLLYRQMFLRK